MTNSPEAYLSAVLSRPASGAASTIAAALAKRYPGSAVFIYGSGISVSADDDPSSVVFDYYVIVPDYRTAVNRVGERIAAQVLPPNVYYFELATPEGMLRSKYALLSVAAFERLVSKRTFHSYFWARFAQPSRLVACPADLRPRMIGAIRTAIETFLQRSQGLADDPLSWRAVWLAGLNASYRAELRAETSDRAAKLIVNYGDWPENVASFALDPAVRRSGGASAAWRLRSVVGAFLSVARLLKATTTFASFSASTPSPIRLPCPPLSLMRQ